MRLISIIGRSCHKYNFCCDKHNFVMTKLLSWKAYFCCNKHIFCCDKSVLVTTKHLSRQTLWQQHYLLWQGMLPWQGTLPSVSENITYPVKECYCQWMLLTMSSNMSYHVKECHLLCKGVLLRQGILLSVNITYHVKQQVLPCQGMSLTV